METIVVILKRYVDRNDIKAIEEVLSEIEDEYEGSWDYIFQAVYIHACLRKRLEIVRYLMTLYDMMSEVEKTSVKQVFAYGRYLLDKK